MASARAHSPAREARALPGKIRHSSFIIRSSVGIRASSFFLMVLFAIFCPIVAAILIMLGASARKTALAASVLTFATALFLFVSLDHSNADFQHVTSFGISPEWRLSFTTGVDGLSVIMVLLASIVTLAAVWFAGTIEKLKTRFMPVFCSSQVARSERLLQSICFSFTRFTNSR